MIEGLNKALAQDNISFKVTFISWKRVKDQKGSAPYLGYIPAWPPEVREGFIGSRPIGTSKLALVSKKSFSKKFKNIEEIFTTSKIGHVRSYDYPKSIERLIKLAPKNREEGGSEESLLRMAQAGRFDFALADTRVVKFYKRKKVINGLLIYKYLIDIPLLIAFKKTGDYKKKLELLNKRLKNSDLSRACDSEALIK